MRATERGATAVIVAIFLAVLCGFAALSLDVGHLFSVRGELQNGADSGALAGAKRLNGTDRELAGAEADARDFARNHPTDLFDVEPTTIQLGAWIPPERTCGDVGGTPVGDPASDGSRFCAIGARTEAAAADINAVRVVTRREGASGSAAGGGAVELAFGAFVGHSEPAPVGAEAIAVSGGPCGQGCPDLPVAIRAGCLYEGGAIRCNADGVGAIYYVGLNPAPADSGGLTSLSEDPASANRVCDILRRDPDCSEPLSSGTEIEIQNGTSWSSNCDDGCSAREYNEGVAQSNNSICEVIRKKADADCDGEVDIGPDGRPAYRAQVPVVMYAGETLDTCGSGDQYNQQAPIVGWATVAIVSARCESTGTSPNQLQFDSKPITKICDEYQKAHGDFSGSTCVAIQLYCNEEDDEESRVGCGWFGTSPQQPVLVR